MWVQDRTVDSLAADEVFPHFIAEELPAGMAGVVISGALAAAMSSLDSSLNAISSVVVGDFAQPLCPACSDTQLLRLGRLVTAAATVLMVCFALLFQAAEKTAMFDLFLKCVDKCLHWCRLQPFHRGDAGWACGRQQDSSDLDCGVVTGKRIPRPLDQRPAPGRFDSAA